MAMHWDFSLILIFVFFFVIALIMYFTKNR